MMTHLASLKERLTCRIQGMIRSGSILPLQVVSRIQDYRFQLPHRFCVNLACPQPPITTLRGLPTGCPLQKFKQRPSWSNK